MTRTIILYGRCAEAMPENEEGMLSVPWKVAYNFNENAGYMISADFADAVILPINSTHGCGQNAAVRISIDRSASNFRGFVTHLWLNDKPYHPVHYGDEIVAVDFDWVAYIPCSAMLT